LSGSSGVDPLLTKLLQVKNTTIFARVISTPAYFAHPNF